MTEQELNRLLEKSGNAIIAEKNVISFLQDQLSLGLPLHEQAAVNAQLARATGDLIHLQLVEANLRASVAIIPALPKATQRKLDKLEAKLDQAIQNDFMLNGTLAIAKTVLEAAEEIGEILSSPASAPNLV
jgi:hypothetical protein